MTIIWLLIITFLVTIVYGIGVLTGALWGMRKGSRMVAAVLDEAIEHPSVLGYTGSDLDPEMWRMMEFPHGVTGKILDKLINRWAKRPVDS